VASSLGTPNGPELTGADPHALKYRPATLAARVHVRLSAELGGAFPPLGVPGVLKFGTMGRTAEQVLNEALELPERDRAEVAARLIESLDHESEDDVDAAWATEIERRCSDRDAGRTTGSDWEDVRQRIEREIFGRS